MTTGRRLMHSREADSFEFAGAALLRAAGTAFWTFTLTTTALLALVAPLIAPLALAMSAAGALFAVAVFAVAVFIGPAALLSRALRRTTSPAVHVACWSTFGSAMGVSTATAALAVRDPDLIGAHWWLIAATGVLAAAAVARGWRVATREHGRHRCAGAIADERSTTPV